MSNDPHVAKKPLGNPICLHCAAELIGHVQFCPECGYPVTPEAASMPYESVLARGFAARVGSSNPRKLIVVIGMWIMFGPMLLIFTIGFFVMLFTSLGTAWQQNPHQDIPGNLYGIAISAALAAIAGTLLYKTTRNYLKLRRDRSEEPEEGDVEAGDDQDGGTL